MSKEIQDELVSAAKALAESHADLLNCQEALDLARSKETAAINRANQAQKRYDAAIARLKAQAPRGTDWRNKPGHRVPIEDSNP